MKGLMDLTCALLPHLRINPAGATIINVSSGGGLYGLPLSSIYCASKFALEGFTESLAFELMSQNIHVKSVIPVGGVTSTKFTETAKAMTPTEPKLLEVYGEYVGKMMKKFMGIAAKSDISADDVAGAILRAATDGTSRLRYFVDDDRTRGFLKARFGPVDDQEYINYMRTFFSQ